MCACVCVCCMTVIADSRLPAYLSGKNRYVKRQALFLGFFPTHSLSEMVEARLCVSFDGNKKTVSGGKWEDEEVARRLNGSTRAEPAGRWNFTCEWNYWNHKYLHTDPFPTLDIPVTTSLLKLCQKPVLWKWDWYWIVVYKIVIISQSRVAKFCGLFSLLSFLRKNRLRKNCLS